MNVLLTTLNAKYIHKNLALRYLFVTKPSDVDCCIKEFTIKDDLDRIVEELVQRSDDVIGFSVYIWNIEQTSYIVKQLKLQVPNKILILGGPEVSFDGAHFVAELGVDAVVCGEGEFVFWDYLQAVKENRCAIDIPGVFTSMRQPTVPYATVDLEVLETYPKPYFLDIDQADMGKRYFYVETSRGCPYHCQYCLSSVQGRVRLFSMAYVNEVLTALFETDATQIKFLDRTFNVDKHRALQIASFIQEHARKHQIFQFEIMAEYVSDDLIAYLVNKDPLPKFRFEIGIQTTNTQSLVAISRYQNFDRLRSVIDRLHQAKESELHVDLIAGLPYEDYRSFQSSFDAVFSLRASEIQLGFLKLLRGTSLRDKHPEYGMLYDPHAPYEVYQTAWMSKEDMQHIHDACFALDALYNTPRIKRTIDALLSQKKQTPFVFFHRLGVVLAKDKYKQLDQLFAQVQMVLQEIYDPREVQALLAGDYYAMFKQRPKRFYPFQLSQEDRTSCYCLLSDFGYHNNELIQYGLFDQDIQDGVVGILFVLYNKQQTLPKRYFIDPAMTTAIELAV